MKTLSRWVAGLARNFPFIRKHAESVSGMLTCFDRVIFKGYLPIAYQQGIEGFVDGRLKMRRCDFFKFAGRQSEKLVEHAKQMCSGTDATYQFLKGSHRKEAIVDRILRERRLTSGLVCVLCVMECCRSFRLAYGKGRPEIRSARRQQRVLYFYFLDRQLGLIHVRLETWFPLTCQVYVNGHSWLARQLVARKIGFVQHDNAFTQLDDGVRVQKIADGFACLGWPKILNRLVRKVNPLMAEAWFDGLSYYWVTEQAEVATDVLFSSRQKLAQVFPSLLQTASRFSPGDILTYLGRRLHWKFDGEVMTDCKTDRLPGARIKHRMKNNWLKMYDKFGQVLRIETVINNPREFRVRKRCVRKGKPTVAYVPMAKGVSNLRHYYKVARASNLRYLDALSAVEAPRVAAKDFQPLVTRKVVAGRGYRGFSPLDADDVRLFEILLNGDLLLAGFRNADIRTRLYRQTNDAVVRRRQANAVGRLLKRLHVRGLIAHVPRTRRWRITRLGQRLFQSGTHLHYHGVTTNHPLAA